MHRPSRLPDPAPRAARARHALCASLLAALVAWPPASAAPRPDAPPASGLQEASRAFEAARMMPSAERIAALEPLEAQVEALLRDDREAAHRAAIHALSGAIATELGRHAEAEAAYRRAGRAEARGAFADDAAFAAIRALEAQGRDPEAAREWLKWEKEHPRSPLAQEARLARAWNALRRGETAEAQRTLAALASAAPWMTNEPRVTLAQATALHAAGKPAEALAALGPKPSGAAATYLSALCLRETGALLRAAAAFQEVADRHAGSPLRDPALLAKANAFLAARDPRSAAQEFARAAERIGDPALKAEAEMRAAGAVFLTGATDSALTLMRALVERHAGTDVAARAQFLVGEALVARGEAAAAIPEYNKVLTSYFRHAVAASAQYRVARCLDALGRRDDALGSYEAVLRGYSLAPEAPAAAYLAGLGHLRRNRPLAAAPYFQLVLDRYASRSDAQGLVAFASPEHQELVEASLCMLEYAYHRAGDLGQLSGAPHVLLQRMPPSRSTWRAWAMLIDADASAAQGRHPEAQASLERLMRDFPDHPVGASATQLLAWTYSKQGKDSLAIATEERLLARWGAAGNPDLVGAAMLDIAHERFNQKRYKEAAAAYEDYLRGHAGHPKRLLALYQAGLCYLRLNRAGDAVDRWEAVVRDSATSPIAERAWARAGDLYFQADRFADAMRCYQGLLEHFSGSSAASLALLRLGQCEYNAGHDARALERFSATLERFPGTPAAREASRGTELALYRLSQTRDGERELARLIEQFPGSAFAADAQFRLAQRAYSEKRWPEAAEAFRQVVSRFPSYSAADQAQFLMAEALSQARRPDESRQAWEQFLAYFPESELRATVRFRLGLLRFDAKDPAGAAVDFTLALQDSTSQEVASAARYNLALCQRMLGQPEEAAAELARYRTAWPADERAAEVAYQLGDLHETAGRATDAAAEYDRALASRPPARLAVELHFRLGRLREQAGDRAAALREYRNAAAAPDRDDPFRLSAVARCAALYEANREFTRALEAYRDLVRNSNDRELVAAAADRVSQLEASVRGR